MAAKKKTKKKTKKKPKKTKKGGKRIRIPTIKGDSGDGCQTRGTQCRLNPNLVRSTPLKKRK